MKIFIPGVSVTVFCLKRRHTFNESAHHSPCERCTAASLMSVGAIRARKWAERSSSRASTLNYGASTRWSAMMMFWNTMTSPRASNCGIALVLVATLRNGILLTFLSFGAHPPDLKSGRKHQRLKGLRSRCQSAMCAVLLVAGSVLREKP
jgi:hypothetical protein